MTTAGYGSWASPLDATALVSEAVALSGFSAGGDARYWVERRPSDGGRQVLVRQLPGRDPEDCFGAPWSARTTVHEYGGSALLVRDGVAYFSNFSDQRIYRLVVGEEPTPLTPPPDTPRAIRYADFALGPHGGELVAVRERHGVGGVEGARGVVNDLVAVSVHDGSARVLASGHDFYAAPRFSPDGARLAYLHWDLPRMPWEGTELVVATYAPGAALGEPRVVAGGPAEWVTQPAFDPDGRLHFLSDRSGFLSLYEEDGTAVLEIGRDLGEPDWVLGLSSYVLLGEGRVLVASAVPAGKELLLADAGAWRVVFPEYSEWSGLTRMGAKVGALAGSATDPVALVELDLDLETVEVVRVSQRLPVERARLSDPEVLRFPTGEGELAFALFYPPTNPEFTPPAGELPPLVVMSHGGPTSRSLPTIDLRIQYLTSRGIAVAEVNYRGSSGFGRAYRERLNGWWGVVDVEDCESAARYLAAEGRVDPDRLAIKGGSAGGYTTLCALTFGETFTAGSSSYGISDLSLLAEETHKFELHYTDTLVGPYPEAIELYRERSPLFHADRLSCPVIFFQGLEDAVVPPNQTEQLVEALRARQIPVAYYAFEGEQHGFRRAETIVTAAEAELAFLGLVYGFVPAGDLPPVHVG